MAVSVSLVGCIYGGVVSEPFSGTFVFDCNDRGYGDYLRGCYFDKLYTNYGF